MIGNLLVYTRKPDDIYTQSLSGSIHFACALTSGEFVPLNLNYGILFPEATISGQNTVREKNLKNPYIFQDKIGLFGIIAVRTAQGGIDDEESCGKILYWTSPDLIHFDYRGLIRLHDDLYVKTVICQYDDVADEYEIIWNDHRDNNYISRAANLTDGEISRPEGTDAFPFTPPVVSLPDINPGNIVQVESATLQAIYDYWTPPRHIKTAVPGEITISSPSELEDIKASAIYSDGSSAQKRILWDIENIDLSSPGTYEIEGRAISPAYTFPLARGYADPDILPRNGKYYFIATNDNKNDVGLYVREAGTIDGLFTNDVTETIILDKDEEKGFIQTFWAPEFHLIGGEIYILFAVGGKEWGPQCHVMKLKKGGHITNPNDWGIPKRVRRRDGSYLTQDGITLDMTYFETDGKSYAVWSYRYGIGTASDTGSMLYIAQIDEKDPSVLTSDPILLSRPLFGWENLHGTINNEGPYPLITDDTVFITFSGGAARGYTYSIGTLSIPRGSDCLDASKWRKTVTPVVNYLSIHGLYGAGHNSLFCDYDGNVMMAYHAEEELVDHGLACCAMHRVHFRQDGTPVFNMDAKHDIDDRFTRVKTVVNMAK